MHFLSDLWLPLLLSAAAAFMASTALHMLLPIHRSDHGSLANEDAVMEVLRAGNIQPGQYTIPACPANMKDWQSPQVRARWERGPVGNLRIIRSGIPSIGASLACWMGLCLVISLCTAYISSHALDHGAAFGEVFRISGAVSVLAYGILGVDQSIFFGRPWRITAKFVGDGIVYGLVTAAIFAWLWPAA